MPKARCPSCSRIIRVGEAQRYMCPHCNKPFETPSLAQQLPVAAPVYSSQTAEPDLFSPLAVPTNQVSYAQRKSTSSGIDPKVILLGVVGLAIAILSVGLLSYFFLWSGNSTVAGGSNASPNNTNSSHVPDEDNSSPVDDWFETSGVVDDPFEATRNQATGSNTPGAASKQTAISGVSPKTEKAIYAELYELRKASVLNRQSMNDNSGGTQAKHRDLSRKMFKLMLALQVRYGVSQATIQKILQKGDMAGWGKILQDGGTI